MAKGVKFAVFARAFGVSTSGKGKGRFKAWVSSSSPLAKGKTAVSKAYRSATKKSFKKSGGDIDKAYTAGILSAFTIANFQKSANRKRK